MSKPTVLVMVQSALVAAGYDGLQCDGECGCSIDDLAPCGDIQENCIAGYLVKPPVGSDAEHDFYICDRKDDRPWE